MSANTKIEWADHTFNPWIGCTKVSPACDNCYAEADFDKRRHVVQWGAGQPRKLTSDSNWAQPLRWNANAQHFAECTGCGRRGDRRTWEADIRRTNPQAHTCCPDRKLVPARPRVFCASLADVFDNEVPQQWRQHLMSLIARTPNLDWLLLTKRIGNAARMLSDASMHDAMLLTADDHYRPPENLWIGATICNQAEADRDIPKLLSVPAARRFLSMEPLLGPVNLRHLNEDREINELDCLRPYTWEEEVEQWRGTEDGWEESFEDHHGLRPAGLSGPMHASIDWVIVGGESGPNARPMHPDWARSLRDQCQAAGVPFLFKQWGEWAPVGLTSLFGAEADKETIVTKDGESWGDYPPAKAYTMRKLGKKGAGRLLDGRDWNQVPASAGGTAP